MALHSTNAFPDRVWESSASTGTGNITLAGAVLSIYQTLNNAVGTGVRISYFLAHKTDGTWERGEGELSDATTFVRSSVSMNSSGAAAAINFASGGLYLYATVHGGSLSWATKVETLTGKTLTDAVLNGGTATFDGLVLGAMSTNYNLADIQCVDVYMGEDSNGWERRTNLPYNNETVPTGSYLGQYTSVTAAVNDGGAVEDWFYNTTDTYFYKITATGSPAASRIYRAGTTHLPLQRAAAVVGTGSSIRLVIFDLTQDGCPMWMEFIAGANYLLTITGTPANAAISAVAFAGGKLIIAENGANGAGLYIFDFSNGQTLKYTNISAQTFIPGLSDPNSTQIAITLSTSTTAPSAYINALATYTAPDAPLDAVTGMPTPVVGGVTQGGAFMILEGGTVTQDSVGAAMDCCAFDMLGNFISKVYSSTIPRVYATESAEWRSASWNRSSLALIGESTTPALTDSPNQIVSVSQEIVSTHEDGVDLLRLNPNTPTNSLIAKIGSNFNTGWMCKPLAAVMCDTDTGSIADTELVTNGSFDTDIAGWTDGSTGTGSISWDAGAIVLTNGGSSSDQGMASQNIVTVTGQTYKCVVDREIGTSIIQIDLSSTYQSPNEAVDAEFYFTAASSSTNIRLINFSNTGDSKIASITVQAVSPDRSGQDNHYDIEGTLTRTAEETGGIALYSGFSADPDALRRAYESAWDVGTAGDFFVRGVAKFSGSVSAATVWCRGDTGASGNRVLLTVNASETFRAVINGTERVAAAGAYNDGSVHTWCLARIAGTLYLIIDGETVDSAANTDDVDNASAITRIGLDYTGASPFDVGSIGMVQESPGCTTTLQEIKTWHHDTARIIESGTVTLANTITAAHYDERNGVTRLLDSDSQELQLNGLVIESSRDFDAGDSIDVGTVAAGASDGRGRATGGSTALQLEVEAKNMREEQPRRAYEYFDIKYEGDGTETSFPSADADIAAVEGCYPIAVTDAGSKQTEGSADDYTVEFDGFNYWAEFAVAPSNTNDVIVTWRREVRK